VTPKKAKTKIKTIIMPMTHFKHINTQNKVLKKAAKQVFREVKDHFKKDKWDLGYSMVVSDVFYRAYGHHLENYLLSELSNSKLPLSLISKDGELVIHLETKNCRRKK
jgi:hypothetical protein